MRRVKYVRISTVAQNIARQEDDGLEAFIDKCSGSIPFAEREQGSRLMNLCERGMIDTIEVHSIDRLGRNTLDIIKTIEKLTDLRINLISKKEGLQTFVNGVESPMTKFIISILGTTAEFELSMMKERQREGIAKAKARGVYKANGGNKSVESDEVFMNKANNQKCLREFKRGESIRRAAKLSGVSTTTAQKIKRVAIRTGALSLTA